MNTDSIFENLKPDKAATKARGLGVMTIKVGQTVQHTWKKAVHTAIKLAANEKLNPKSK